jgi:hypothetical protein
MPKFDGTLAKEQRTCSEATAQKHRAAGAFAAHYISLYCCSGYAVIPFDVNVGPLALASTKRSFLIWSNTDVDHLNFDELVQ